MIKDVHKFSETCHSKVAVICRDSAQVEKSKATDQVLTESDQHLFGFSVFTNVPCSPTTYRWDDGGGIKF